MSPNDRVTNAVFYFIVGVMVAVVGYAVWNVVQYVSGFIQ